MEKKQGMIYLYFFKEYAICCVKEKQSLLSATGRGRKYSHVGAEAGSRPFILYFGSG